MERQFGSLPRRPRKRPPLRSYVPFTLFVLVLLLFLTGIIWLLASALGMGRAPGGSQAAPRIATATATPSLTPVLDSSPLSTPVVPPVRHTASVPVHATATATATHAATTTADTPIRSSLVAYTPTIPPGAIVPGGPLPTRTPTPPPAPDGNAHLVIARAVDLSGKPLQESARFVSPAMRLYAIATVRRVKSSDMLRFVFKRNGRTLAGDDISFNAGIDGSNQLFNAYADYRNGAAPLPRGTYTVLFYRNSRLEAESTFRVG